jgi:hypothetical protein
MIYYTRNSRKFHNSVRQLPLMSCELDPLSDHYISYTYHQGYSKATCSSAESPVHCRMPELRLGNHLLLCIPLPTTSTKSPRVNHFYSQKGQSLSTPKSSNRPTGNHSWRYFIEWRRCIRRWQRRRFRFLLRFPRSRAWFELLNSKVQMK